MDELMQQFAIEARELVQQASDDLLALEAAPHDRQRLESAFRAIHTLKGSVGLFDLASMHNVLHQSEDILSKARASTIVVDVTLIDPLLAVIEWVDESIDGIVREGRLSQAQEKQATRLLGLVRGKMTERETDELTDVPLAIPEWASAIRDRLPVAQQGEHLVAVSYRPHPECFFNGDDPLATMSRLPELRHLEIALCDPPQSLNTFDPFRCSLLINAICEGPLSAVEAEFRLIPDQVKLAPLPGIATEASSQKESQPERLGERQTSTMRVDAARIDSLVEIAGELIAAKNGLPPIAELARAGGNDLLAKAIHSSHLEIERLVGSLYSAVTRARMIPLEQTFRRFPRLVRETAAKLGKSVDLIIEGETVEADREIVENLFEPLLHLVRNSLDHGIEHEVERLKASKSPKGRISLRATQRGEVIDLEVSDDGRGMLIEDILRAATDRGLVTKTTAANLTELDILQFVFAPGFSTTNSVSALSGRGVGLDVVKRSIQRLGGDVEMQTAMGQGTSFTLRLPVSFSMTRIMVVEVDGERYGIPIGDVIETQKVPVAAVQLVRGNRAFILRDRTVPLLHLGQLLNTTGLKEASNEMKVLIIQSGAERIGIAVDTIAERVETLTRPLAGLLQGMTGIAGTTLLGDGKVLLVLNLEELIG
jgi:two-component system chemotaxis sensor kinase CheA